MLHIYKRGNLNTLALDIYYRRSDIIPPKMRAQVHDELNFNVPLDEVEREMIRKALERHHGRRKNAAKDLKISERTLYRKIKEYGLE